METKTCFCICYYGYIESPSFFIEEIYCGEDAEKKAIQEAIKLNLQILKECIEEDLEEDEGYLMLTDENTPEMERLEEYIRSLDYCGGKYIVTNLTASQ